MPQLDNLGLKENPFKNNMDQRFFYADQNRAQILESTEHLIEYSSNLQVIIGSEGMGKSHLLETLAHRLDNNWRIARIKETEQYDTLTLIQAVLDAFGAAPEQDMELLEALETQLAEIIQLGFKPVLFIDDAQVLSTDSIRFLIQLSQQKQNDEPYINIVLFGTMQITEHLQSTDLKDYRDVIHIATLTNFDKEGVSGYLRHKMAVAGFDRESPFTSRIIDSIYSDSKGVPEKVNFFANKFLVSSGKGENYIDVSKKDSSHAASTQEEHFMDGLNGNELAKDKTDRAEDQINRLAEKFDEIEKMGEQPVDDFFIDKDSMEQINREEMIDDSLDQAFETEDVNSLGLPKFVIPIAVVGLILTALVVINTVFDNDDESSDRHVDNNKIELLPLELPAEKQILPESNAIISNKLEGVNNPESDNPPEVVDIQEPLFVEGASRKQTFDTIEPAQNDEENTGQAETETDRPEKTEIEIIASEISEQKVAAPATELDLENQPIVTQNPEIKRVDPEPVIGSNKRQTITIIGKNLDKDGTLYVSWGKDKKAFSQKQTPKQWNYVSSNKIKLTLTTGIDSQQWQVYAKNKDSQPSAPVTFDVVKPFIATMAIKSIAPSPVIGSEKRQAISIKGQGFTKQTVLELKWDKNSKHFSARLSPGQFEYINSNEIKLFITTGAKARKWRVIAKQPDSNASSSASFDVIVKNASMPEMVKAGLKDESWIKQQSDEYFTIQLFGSYNKKAIDDLINKYQLKGDLAWFKSQRNGQDWYSMTYGKYKNKALANDAVKTLDSKLRKPAPWVRSFRSIKTQLGHKGSAQNTPTTEQPDVSKVMPAVPVVMNESWIWTQNPTDYTLQLVVLSTEKSVIAYANKHKIEAKSVHFKFMRNGKSLYALIYGNFSDKASAEKVKKQMIEKIKGSKPWVRQFSEIHSLMSP